MERKRSKMNAQAAKVDMNVVIYSKSNCPFCVKAKAWFEQHGLTYTEIVLDDEEQRLEFYQKIPGARSVPQIFINDKHIGTYNDLMKVGDSIIKKSSGGLMEFSPFANHQAAITE